MHWGQSGGKPPSALHLAAVVMITMIITGYDSGREHSVIVSRLRDM